MAILEGFQILTVLAIVVCIGLLVIFNYRSVARSIENKTREHGDRSREEWAEEVKSVNRLHDWVRTGMLWIGGGAVVFLFFFTIILRRLGKSTDFYLWVTIVGAIVYLFIAGQYLAKSLSYRGRYHPVIMVISITPDGRKIAIRETLYTEIQEIGRYKKEDRREYFGNMSIQFCKYFRTKLLREAAYERLGVIKTVKTTNPGTEEVLDYSKVNWKDVTYEDLKWRHDESNKTNGDIKWDIQTFPWDAFCEQHCPSNKCNFSITRKQLLEEEYWRMYEIRGLQFPPFHMWVLIMHSDFEKEFTKEEMQMAISGILWGVRGSRIECNLVEVNHTIDGEHPSGRPELVPCPIFYVTSSTYTRQLAHQGITPESMSDTEMYRALKNRPISGGVAAAGHVRRADAFVSKVLGFIVPKRAEMEGVAEHFIEKLINTGKKKVQAVDKKWLWVLLIAGLSVVAFYVFFVRGGLINVGETANTTQGLF